MKELVAPLICILMWGLEIDADTFEVLTIPYDKIFPERYGTNGQHGQHGQQGHRGKYGQNGNTYERPGFQQPQRPGYQPNYPSYQQPGVGVSARDWVCRNPSNGDMVIISSESLPFQYSQNPRQPQVPNFQPNQPSQPVHPLQPVQLIQPQYPVPNQGTQDQNPFLPNSNQTPAPVIPVQTAAPIAPINCNDYPPHPMCGETIILGTTTTRVPETTPNTNGQGLIDVRIRGQYPSTKDEDSDRLVFSD